MYTNQLFVPSKQLAPYISSILVMESELPISFKILPQPNAVLTLNYKGNMYYEKNGAYIKCSAMNVCGPYDNFKQRTIADNTGIAVIKFAEGGATAMFDLPINELFSATISLDTFFAGSEISSLEQQLALTTSHEGKVQLIERFLVSKIKHHRKDDLVLQATQRIKSAGGNLKINELCRHLYISESQFEKRFRKSVGTSAKKFSSLVRISSLLATDHKDRSLTSRAYDAGYFDQAHFIRDFKSYTGLTPHQFFKLRHASSFSLMPIGLIDDN